MARTAIRVEVLRTRYATKLCVRRSVVRARESVVIRWTQTDESGRDETSNLRLRGIVPNEASAADVDVGAGPSYLIASLISSICQNTCCIIAIDVTNL